MRLKPLIHRTGHHPVWPISFFGFRPDPPSGPCDVNRRCIGLEWTPKNTIRPKCCRNHLNLMTDDRRKALYTTDMWGIKIYISRCFKAKATLTCMFRFVLQTWFLQKPYRSFVPEIREITKNQQTSFQIYYLIIANLKQFILNVIFICKITIFLNV